MNPLWILLFVFGVNTSICVDDLRWLSVIVNGVFLTWLAVAGTRERRRRDQGAGIETTNLVRRRR